MMLPSPLREAPRPRRTRRQLFDRYFWTLPAGLAFAFGLYGLTFGRTPVEGLGFLIAGAAICWIFEGIGE